MSTARLAPILLVIALSVLVPAQAAAELPDVATVFEQQLPTVVAIRTELAGDANPFGVGEQGRAEGGEGAGDGLGAALI